MLEVVALLPPDSLEGGEGMGKKWQGLSPFSVSQGKFSLALNARAACKRAGPVQAL